jgi:hypothetical protein
VVNLDPFCVGRKRNVKLFSGGAVLGVPREWRGYIVGYDSLCLVVVGGEHETSAVNAAGRVRVLLYRHPEIVV